MKRCPYCKIEIKGDLYKCPLCQSKLSGSDEQPPFPKLEAQKKKSVFYRIQLLLVWTLLIVGVGLDFMVGLRLPGFPELHWSLLLSMWLVAFEFGIMRQFKPGTGSAGKVSMLMLIIAAAWMVTAYFFGLLDITLNMVIPIALAATIITNFVLAMIDRNGNSMAYLLSGFLLSLIPGIIQFIVRDSMPLAWVICMMIGATLFVGAIIFKGRAVTAELQRRFHI
ncbi:MAG: hypothetical protein J6Z09_01265 [Lachnospiraceae bacterium]|nr:hypothetical protein [Lachnospiraceae bacterium]